MNLFACDPAAGIEDRVRSLDQRELVVAPDCALRSFVRAVPDLDGLLRKRRPRVLRVEDELDHLPVALMEVVPVVEGVEQPVLERELSRMAGVGGDMRVRGRLAPLGEPS